MADLQQFLLPIVLLVGILLAYMIYTNFQVGPTSKSWSLGQPDPILSYNDYLYAGKEIPAKQPGEKRIVWIMHSYVPNVRAGSEITAEAQIDFLRKKGWNSFVLTHRWCVPSWKETPIFPIQKHNISRSKYIEQLLDSADILAVQNYSVSEFLFEVERFHKPVVVFIHTHNDNRDSLAFRFGSPMYIVYNVNYLKLESGNQHPSIVVHPAVETTKFKLEKKDPKYITLVNSNENKGGSLIPKLAAALPEYQFLVIKGGYADQVIDPNPPKNLTYWDTQEDMTKVYSQTKILLMPSKLETWGRVAVEAMANGTPVITSRAQGLLECVGKAVNSCDRNDISCWIETIKTLMTDEKAYDDASNKARERVKELDSENEFERLNGFLDDIRVRHSEKEEEV